MAVGQLSIFCKIEMNSHNNRLRFSRYILISNWVNEPFHFPLGLLDWKKDLVQIQTCCSSLKFITEERTVD